MKKIIYFFVITLSLVNFSFAAKELTIDINNGEVKKINLVFEKINLVNSSNGKIIDNGKILTEKILRVIKNNLDTTELFSTQNTKDSIFDNYETVKEMSNTDLTNFVISKYSKTTVDAVLSGFLEVNKDNKLELKIRLWDILDQRELFAKYYVINETNIKRVSDVISDSTYEFLTGESSGHFDSKIVFVSEIGKVRNREKKITMVDFDGSNLNYVTNGKNLVLTPIFSKFNKGEIVYLEYKGDKPHLFKLDLITNKSEMIGDIKEMTYAPNFNPNGINEIIFSATGNGASNIFKLNFDTKELTQLTFENAIETVPSYSPDGEKIVFVSDKTGIRKLYIMDKNGDNVRLIGKSRGVYDKPNWSPDGKLISFVKIDKGEFSIGLMTPNGESERSIMNAYLVEGIKWSPNGRYLIYSKQKGPFGKASIPSIYTIDILTGIEHRIPTPDNQGATDPDWIKK